MCEKVRILNINIDNFSFNDFLYSLEKGFIVTPNVDHLIKLQKDRNFYNLYRCADYIVCDSQIIKFASKFLGAPILHVIKGADLLPKFCNYHKDNEKIKVFLLGGTGNVAKIAQEKINRKIGRHIVVGAYSPSFNIDKEESAYIIESINKTDAIVLAVGLGAPKQEKWIYRYRKHLKNIKIFMAIGATIDFEAGNVKRAPNFISKIGFEWLYRLYREPKRLWRRYLVDDLPFLYLIIKQKFGLYKDPFK